MMISAGQLYLNKTRCIVVQDPDRSRWIHGGHNCRPILRRVCLGSTALVVVGVYVGTGRETGPSITFRPVRVLTLGAGNHSECWRTSIDSEMDEHMSSTSTQEAHSKNN